MTDTKTRAFVGFVGFAAIASILGLGLGGQTGCSSSNGSAGTTGTAGTSGGTAGTSGGTAGHAGTSGGTAGTTGGTAGTTGGTAGTTGGTAGTSGGGGTTGAACTAVPAGGLISDFSGADGGSSTGGVALGTPYSGADSNGSSAPTASTSTGALVLSFNTGISTNMYPYAYYGLPFAACVDASAFTGVKFSVSGSLSTGCTIQFSTIDKEHNTVANNGTCTATSCYASAKGFTLSSTATDVTIKFADQTGGGTNPGAAVVDPTMITGIQWQVNPVGGEAGSSCVGMVTIDNITFM
jgi:hypothetical protein